MIWARSVINRPWASLCRRTAILSALLAALLLTLLLVRLWPLNIYRGFGVNPQHGNDSGQTGMPGFQGLVFVTHHKTGMHFCPQPLTTSKDLQAT